MKYRESGMPDEKMWGTFFDPRRIISQMNVNGEIKTLLDIGCGYGTFLIPAAALVGGKVIGLDIEREMIETCQEKARDQNLLNLYLICGDFSDEETRKTLKQNAGAIDYICLFNILHCERPLDLLSNVYDLLANNGKIGVIHWKYEETPRGPSMEIRPTPETIIGWASETGFTLVKQVELPPYHFGLIFIKKLKEDINNPDYSI